MKSLFKTMTVMFLLGFGFPYTFAQQSMPTGPCWLDVHPKQPGDQCCFNDAKRDSVTCGQNPINSDSIHFPKE